MATSTFERNIVINDCDSKEKLKKFLESSTPARKLSISPFSSEEKKRSELLLAQFFSHSSH